MATKVKPQQIQNPYKFRAYRNGALTLTAGAWTKLPIETEDYDTNNNFDPVTNNRYVAPVSGYYHFDGRMNFNGTHSVSVIALYKNGNGIARGGDSRVVSQGMNGLVLSTDVYLAKDDYVELWYYCDQAIPISVAFGSADNYFSGHLIGV